MIAPSRNRPHRWNPWHWDLPLAALAGMLAILFLAADRPLFLGFNRLSAYTGDGFWAYVTILGDTLIALALLLPLARRWPELAWTGLLAGLLATLFVQGFKEILPTPRPASILPLNQFHIIGRAFLNGSFPSGHTTTAFTFVGVIILWLSAQWRNRLALPLLFFAGLVGLSRMVVGAHWPLDVLGGIVAGWLGAVLGTFWARHWSWGITPLGRRCLVFLLAGCALTALLSYRTGYPQADIWRRILAALALLGTLYQIWLERRALARDRLAAESG